MALPLLGGGPGSRGGASGGTTDPSFSSVVLLMGYEGSNGDTGAPGFTDQSTANNKGTASAGGDAAISTANFQFGSSSQLTTGGLSIFATNADWNLGAGRFTIECWVRPTLISGVQGIVGVFGSSAPTLGWILYLNGSALAWNVSTTGSDNNNDLSGGTMLVNTWAAICVDYDGSKYRLYKDGAMISSFATPRTIFASTKQLAIGSNADAALTYHGYIDEVRITKGVARYATDTSYTVAVAAFPRS